jgi:biopolymer transport protein ExbD
VLLIFFIIISSVVKDPALKVVLPKGVNNVSTVTETIKVSVDKNLNYEVNNKPTTFSRLPFDLRAVLKGNTNATVSVRGDKDVRYEDVMNLVMLADKEGAKVVLALDPVKK